MYKCKNIMTHDEKMEMTWKFIKEHLITDNPDNLTNNTHYILVRNLYDVRNAFYNDLDTDNYFYNEEPYDFFERHKIDWVKR